MKPDYATPSEIITLRGKLSQAKIAEKWDVNERTWRRYESGETRMRRRDFDNLKAKLAKERK